MTPHKLEMVPLGNGITAEIDSLTGKQVGQIKGQPDLKSIKDAAGNEYMFNPADPNASNYGRYAAWRRWTGRWTGRAKRSG
jgi:hypothetical protein